MTLPEATPHRSAKHRLWPRKVPGPGVYHPLRFTGAPELWKSPHPHPELVSVLSIHHQAIEKLGAKLTAIASSIDGKVVEAISHQRFPNVLAVQFHPESYFLDRSLTAKGERKKLIAPQPPNAPTLAFHRRFWQRFARLLARPSRDKSVHRAPIADIRPPIDRKRPPDASKEPTCRVNPPFS